MLKATWTLEDPQETLKWPRRKRFFATVGCTIVSAVATALAPFPVSIFFMIYTAIFTALMVQEGLAWYDYDSRCTILADTMAREIQAEIDREIIAAISAEMMKKAQSHG